MRATQSNQDNVELVDALIANWEDETVEFKEASRDFDTDRMGRYVSALCNEANLAGTDSAWLVFGVRNKTREVVGTEYRNNKERLESTKLQMFNGTIPNIALRGIREVDHPGGRVVVFEIPPAPQGVPISWKGHFYARVGENLEPLSMEKVDAIRAEESMFDWTAQVIPDAELSDLSPEAITEARRRSRRRTARGSRRRPWTAGPTKSSSRTSASRAGAA